jgi:hypothetical protein
MIAIIFTILSAALPVASLHGNASAAVPTGSTQHLENLNTCGHSATDKRHSAMIQVLLSQIEPTAALRVAIWIALAIITALLIFIIEQVQRHFRPAKTGSKRWEAGWAGKPRHGRPLVEAARRREEVNGCPRP